MRCDETTLERIKCRDAHSLLVIKFVRLTKAKKFHSQTVPYKTQCNEITSQRKKCRTAHPLPLIIGLEA
jgi:hypothetical protein